MPKYMIDGATLSGLADAIREKSGSTAAMTPGEMVEAVCNISQGENLPEAEPVSFSAAQLDPDVRYSIGYNWFAQVVERLRVMVNTDRDFTPDEIVYWLGRVAYIPQGYASSEFALGFESTAVGILPTVYKGTANSEFTLNFESSAVGALSE